MRRYAISWIVLIALLSGCGGTKTVLKSVIEPCPTSAPDVTCPPMPDKGTTLREMLEAWETAKARHAQGAAAITAWQTSWKGCAKH